MTRGFSSAPWLALAVEVVVGLLLEAAAADPATPAVVDLYDLEPITPIYWLN